MVSLVEKRIGSPSQNEKTMLQKESGKNETETFFVLSEYG